MPLYRTVSDRGLWKKYQKDNVQHFHKAHYVKDKSKPQVSNPVREVQLQSSKGNRGEEAFLGFVNGGGSEKGHLLL